MFSGNGDDNIEFSQIVKKNFIYFSFSSQSLIFQGLQGMIFFPLDSFFHSLESQSNDFLLWFDSFWASLIGRYSWEILAIIRDRENIYSPSLKNLLNNREESQEKTLSHFALLSSSNFIPEIRKHYKLFFRHSWKFFSWQSSRAIMTSDDQRQMIDWNKRLIVSRCDTRADVSSCVASLVSRHALPLVSLPCLPLLSLSCRLSSLVSRHGMARGGGEFSWPRASAI